MREGKANVKCKTKYLLAFSRLSQLSSRPSSLKMKLMISSRTSMKITMTLPRGFSRVEAAAYIGLGVTFFDANVADGLLPLPVRIGRRKLWDRFELDAAFDRLKGSVAESRGNPWDS
jgi:hypothetical protein